MRREKFKEMKNGERKKNRKERSKEGGNIKGRKQVTWKDG